MSAHTTTTRRSVGFLALATNILFWGLAGPIVKYGLMEVSAPVFLFYRFVLVVAISTPFIWFWRKKWNSVRTWQDVLILIGVGLLTNPLSLVVLFWGVSMTTASAAEVVMSLTPLFVVTAGVLFLREHITRQEVLGIGLALLGTLWIILDTPKQAGVANPVLGNVLIVGYNILWAAGILLMKKYAYRYSPIIFGYTGWLTGMLCCGALVLFTQPQFLFKPLAITQLSQASSAVLYMAILGSLVGFTAYQIAQKVFTAAQVSLTSYLLPLIGIPFAAVWLHEQLRWVFFPAVGLVVLGVFLAETHKHSRVRTLRSAPSKQRLSALQYAQKKKHR